MNIVLVPEDGTIGIDGEFILGIEKEYLKWVPENIHAFHWYGDVGKGEIEYSHHPLEPKPSNQIVNELGIFQTAITTFEEEIERRTLKRIEEESLIESQIDYWEELRFTRNLKLTGSDWTQLPDAPLTEEQKELWIIYRQELRDLPESIDDPKALVIDPNHSSWPIPPQ
jgi:hypothetical protein